MHYAFEAKKLLYFTQTLLKAILQIKNNAKISSDALLFHKIELIFVESVL